MNLILAIATLLGGLAAILYFIDKARTTNWGKHTFTRRTQETSLAASDLVFPEEVVEAVNRNFPNYRLPRVGDLVGDWAAYFDKERLFPLFCTGNFSGYTGEFALFIIGDNDYKLIALIRNTANDLAVRQLTSGVGTPHSLFVHSVSPGTYRPSELVQGLGERKILRLKYDGINFGMFESADSIYKWDGRKKDFVQIWMSD